MSLAGRLLVASTMLGDPNFDRTVVFMLQHDDEGALGLVLNRPSDSAVHDHLPWLAGAVIEPYMVFVGGPVEPEIAIALESTQAPVRPTALQGVGLADVNQADEGALLRVFSGYSGWGEGQLEGELAEGAWIVVVAEPGDVFTADPGGLWARVLRRQGGHLTLLSTYPPDPSLN
ncbi:MAG: YqgE/AlgH family protein [Acidimicrobiia bacterium]